MSGSEGVKLYREKYPSMHVMMPSGLSDDDHVLHSICNGACGYVLKKTPPGKLLETTSDAVKGGALVTPEIARKIFEPLRKAKPHSRNGHVLTPDEMRLLRLLAQGYSYQSAAENHFPIASSSMGIEQEPVPGTDWVQP